MKRVLYPAIWLKVIVFHMLFFFLALVVARVYSGSSFLPTWCILFGPMCFFEGSSMSVVLISTATTGIIQYLAIASKNMFFHMLFFVIWILVGLVSFNLTAV
jgi:hypothetical protein